MQSLRPLGFLLSSASFDWLGRLESSVSLYMTGYIRVNVGSQAHARTHTNTESSLNAHTHKAQAPFGHVLEMEIVSCTVQTQQEGCVCASM